MYNLITLTACLAPLLGFRQSPEGSIDEPQLAEALLAPAGAVAVQDIHPLLTLANIRAAAPQVPAAGDDIGAQLSTWLDQTRTAAVAKVLTAFATRKKLSGTGKTIIADVALTGRSGEYRRKVIKQGRFVGLALRGVVGRDVVLSITGLGTQFTELNPDFRLYLYHSSSNSPVATYDVPRENRVYFEWTPVAITLPPITEGGGEYRLGYFEDDLVGQAVDLQHDFSTRPSTGGCCGSDFQLFDKYAALVQVRAFTAVASIDTDELPTDRVSYVTDSNFGLNLRLSAVCDLSDYFCRYASVFTEALQLQLAVDLLRMMAFTMRNNAPASVANAHALMELNDKTTPGSDHASPGLLSRLDAAMKALDVDLSGVSPKCLPCENKGSGYKTGAV
jgi:hypothetical protein